MKKEGNLMLCSIGELAEIIALSIDIERPSESKVPSVAFASDTCTEEGMTLEEIEKSSTGWYGIHRVDTGFDSNDLHLVADYYGGGSPKFIHIHDGLTRRQIECFIMMAMSGAIRDNEDTDVEPQLIAKFDEGESGVTEVTVEIYEGMVVNVYATTDDISVNVIDRDVQEEIAQNEVDEALEDIRVKCLEHRMFNVW